MMQGTPALRQAHTKAPAVVAMTNASLRSGAFFVFRAYLVAGTALPWEVKRM
jgi:hypothetical protein